MKLLIHSLTSVVQPLYVNKKDPSCKMAAIWRNTFLNAMHTLGRKCLFSVAVVSFRACILTIAWGWTILNSHTLILETQNTIYFANGTDGYIWSHNMHKAVEYGRHFAEDIPKFSFMERGILYCYLVELSFTYVPQGLNERFENKPKPLYSRQKEISSV